MVLHIIRADILLIAHITQLAKYPRVLYAKPSIKIYIRQFQFVQRFQYLLMYKRTRTL